MRELKQRVFFAIICQSPDCRVEVEGAEVGLDTRPRVLACRLEVPHIIDYLVTKHKREFPDHPVQVMQYDPRNIKMTPWWLE